MLDVSINLSKLLVVVGLLCLASLSSVFVFFSIPLSRISWLSLRHSEMLNKSLRGLLHRGLLLLCCGRCRRVGDLWTRSRLLLHDLGRNHHVVWFRELSRGRSHRRSVGHVCGLERIRLGNEHRSSDVLLHCLRGPCRSRACLNSRHEVGVGGLQLLRRRLGRLLHDLRHHNRLLLLDRGGHVHRLLLRVRLLGLLNGHDLRSLGSLLLLSVGHARVERHIGVQLLLRVALYLVVAHSSRCLLGMIECDLLRCLRLQAEALLVVETGCVLHLRRLGHVCRRRRLVMRLVRLLLGHLKSLLKYLNHVVVLVFFIQERFVQNLVHIRNWFLHLRQHLLQFMLKPWNDFLLHGQFELLMDDLPNGRVGQLCSVRSTTDRLGETCIVARVIRSTA